MIAKVSGLKSGDRHEFACLQIDIAGHSKLADSERVLHRAKGRFQKQVAGIVTTYGGQPFKWEGDGGAFLFPVTDGREFNEVVQAAICILETLPGINEKLRQTTGLRQPFSVRISLDAGTAVFDENPGLITGDFLNAFLKHERAIGLVDAVTITERVYRQLSNSLRGRFTAYKDSCELGCQIYRSDAADGRRVPNNVAPMPPTAEAASRGPAPPGPASSVAPQPPGVGGAQAAKGKRAPWPLITAVGVMLAACAIVVMLVIPSPPEQPPPPKEIRNSLDMTLVRIEPGPFTMGSTGTQIDSLLKRFQDAGASRDDFEPEQHVRTVTITRPFYMAAHEVTVGQFRRFTDENENVYETEAEKFHAGSKGIKTGDREDPSITWRNPGFGQDDNHPVVCVSPKDVHAFLEWLNARPDTKAARLTYQLPTEEQWEYACRATTLGLYGASDDPESLADIANVADASLADIFPGAARIKGRDGFVYTAPVNRSRPNAWKLYGMIGNVWEMCDEGGDATFHASSPKMGPRNLTEGSRWILRGGSWYAKPWACRPAWRSTVALPGSRSDCIGFRVVAVREEDQEN